MTTSTATQIPAPGTPATIHLYTDTIAAVVVRRTAKTVTLAKVEVGELEITNQREVEAGGLPVNTRQGILDRPIAGSEHVCRLRKNGRFYSFGSAVTFGTSVEIRDYRY